MKALICKQLGPAENLVVEDVETPEPKANEVLIKVHACPVNFPDSLIIHGKYQYRPDPPFSPGSEVSGEIIKIGEDVTQLKAGQRVISMVGWGGMVEYVATDAQNVTPISDDYPDINMSKAACLSMTYGTAYHAYVQRAQLQAGETVAVLGAGGGVGLAAVELAKAFGANVIACAGSQAKLDQAKQAGADELIDYSNADLKTALKDATQGKGCDVVFDTVGGQYAEAALRATAWRGRYLVVGFAAGDIPKFPLNLLLLKGCAALGVFWGDFVKRENDLHQQNMQALLELMRSEKINPYISKTYALEDGGKAIDDLANRRAVGKLVVEI